MKHLARSDGVFERPPYAGNSRSHLLAPAANKPLVSRRGRRGDPSEGQHYIAAVSWKTWSVLAIGIALFLFYLGGSYSFRYTHVCVKSHHKTVYDATAGAPEIHTITICDVYSGNSKHWSPGDTARALYSEPLTGWNEVIVIVIALAIGVAAFFERRKRKRSDRTR